MSVEGVDLDEWTDGEYPTEEALERIEKWPYRDAAACLDFARAIWHWPDWQGEDLSEAEREVVHADPDQRFARFATGGWSGNESIIAALNANRMIRAICWRLTSRGGLHIYEYPALSRREGLHS